MKKAGLVLSGGGARGFAHVGVLKVLEKNNIKISSIATSSMGSVIGALYAGGVNASEIEKLIQNIKPAELIKVWQFSLSGSGFAKTDGLIKYILSHIKAKKFEELSIKLAVNSVDLISEKEVVFSKGNLFDAISASTCFPGVFIPRKLDNMLLVDGGLINPLGIGNTKDVDFSIVVNVGTGFGKNANKKNPNLFDISKISVNIMQDELIRLKLLNTKEKYVLITPDVETIELWDIKYAKKVISEGEKAANSKITEIKRLYS